MKVLFDTNVLIAGIVQNHPNHPNCLPWFEKAVVRELEGLMCAHSLAEIYAVLTKLPIAPRVRPQQALQIIQTNLQHFRIIELATSDYVAATNMAVVVDVSGGGIYDALIAQAALKAGADRLLTNNAGHFRRLGPAVSALVEIPA